MTTSSEDRRGLTLAGAGVSLRADGAGSRRFNGHAAVFDSRAPIGDPRTWGFYEEIVPGAYTSTIAEDDQRFLVDHSPYHVVSRRSAETLALSQDVRGLAVDSALDTGLSYVADLERNVDNRNITGMSFAFLVRDGGEEWSTERVTIEGETYDVDVRRLTDLRVPEVSAVTFPAYDDTDVGLRAEDPVRAVGLALRSRPNAAALFEARSRHRPELARYFEREQVSVTRNAPPTTPTEPTRDARRRERARASDWYRIEQRAENAPDPTRSAEVLIYDRIGGWFGVEAQEFVRDLAALDVDHITLRINSPGGDVYDGIAILNALRGHPARVTAVVEGLAASAASFIAMAGERVEVWRNAEMMIHEASGIAIGDSTELHAFAERLDRIGDNIASIYALRAGGTAEDWREVMRAETWYTADEAVEAGLADAVREPPAREDDDDENTPDDPDEGDEPDDERSRRHDLTQFRYTGRAAAPPPLARRNATTRSVEPDRQAILRNRRMEVLAARFGG